MKNDWDCRNFDRSYLFQGVFRQHPVACTYWKSLGLTYVLDAIFLAIQSFLLTNELVCLQILFAVFLLTIGFFLQWESTSKRVHRL